jgi:hypothetical protein
VDVAGMGQVVGNCPGGNAPRLGDMDFNAGLPQPTGDARRLAGPGLCGQDQHRVGGDFAFDALAEVIDRQPGLEMHE